MSWLAQKPWKFNSPTVRWQEGARIRKLGFILVWLWLFSSMARAVTELETPAATMLTRHALTTLSSLIVAAVMTALGLIGLWIGYWRTGYFGLPRLLLLHPIAHISAWMCEPIACIVYVSIWTILLLAETICPPNSLRQALWAFWVCVQQSRVEPHASS